MKEKLFLSLFCLVACSCASVPHESIYPVYITNTAKFNLLPAENISCNIDELQHISAVFGSGSKKREIEGDAYVVASQNGILMILLNEFGTTMAELCYDGKSVRFESPLFPKNIKAEYVVADFQFCWYDFDTVRKALSNIGLDFYRDDSEKTETYIISKGKKIISKITKTENMVQYTNFLRNYSYTLTSSSF